jgi:hypothetical protein
MRGQVKLNTAPSKLATLARRLARGFAKIPAPAPIYVLVDNGELTAAYRNRKLVKEVRDRFYRVNGRSVDIVVVPVRG